MGRPRKSLPEELFRARENGNGESEKSRSEPNSPQQYHTGISDSVSTHSQHPWQPDKHHHDNTHFPTYQQQPLRFILPKQRNFYNDDYFGQSASNHALYREEDKCVEENLSSELPHKYHMTASPRKRNNESPHEYTMTSPRKRMFEPHLPPLLETAHRLDRPPPLKRIRQEKESDTEVTRRGDDSSVYPRTCDLNTRDQRQHQMFKNISLDHMTGSTFIKQEVTDDMSQGPTVNCCQTLPHHLSRTPRINSQPPFPSCSPPSLSSFKKNSLCPKSEEATLKERHTAMLKHEFDESYWSDRCLQVLPVMCQSQQVLVSNLATAYLELVESFCRDMPLSQVSQRRKI